MPSLTAALPTPTYLKDLSNAVLLPSLDEYFANESHLPSKNNISSYIYCSSYLVSKINWPFITFTPSSSLKPSDAIHLFKPFSPLPFPTLSSSATLPQLTIPKGPPTHRDTAAAIGHWCHSHQHRSQAP